MTDAAVTPNEAREESGLDRLCVCGCGQPPRLGSRYADYERCRQRSYRSRVRAASIEAGLPASLSLRAATTTKARNGDAQKQRRARTPDMRLSYSKVLEAVAMDFVRLAGFDMRYARRRAAETLAPLLSDRQRKHLQERGR